jgi:hypothetical protein
MDLEALWATLRRAGFSRTSATGQRVEMLLPEGIALLRPRGMVRIVARDWIAGSGVSALPEPIRGAEFVGFGLTTVGAPIDQRARSLS